MQKFLHATDFQSLMYPCFTLCRILGTFPYTINDMIFETSRPQYILSVITTCVSCVFTLTILYQLNIITKSTNFEAITSSLEIICSSVPCCFIIIVTLVSSSSRMRLLQTIKEISSRLSPKSYQKLSRLIHTKDIFGSLCMICNVFLYVYKMMGFNIIFMIFSTHAVLLPFTMDMLYMNCVCILKACYKEINNSLLYMQEFIINKKPPVTMMFYEQRNTFLIMKLKTLKKQHLMISNTVQMLNRSFSLQLLATIVTCFSGIIFGLYHYFHIVEWYNEILNLTEINEMMLIGTIYSIVKLLLLAWVCETGKNQAEEIRTTIHDVLNSNKDEQIKHELQLFSLQILHSSTFFAKGLNIDAKYFATMVGTVTTYMLILLQFMKIAHSCDGNSTINKL
ncbi:PREDICTED: uncharacterized protein LOC105568945 [Vollenhovia emeryi]|uniref:uncharacterized protein LOC105568945 n=1 Tax=Vollenhovia emeryi TaxID=411798 RepID=UPI0005F3A1FB|nr:PREDICTED: uncharacterized protein LOC105568945 [Vollenhovia emeryi]